jgi:hypothetical protein
MPAETTRWRNRRARDRPVTMMRFEQVVRGEDGNPEIFVKKGVAEVWGGVYTLRIIMRA